MGFDVTLEPAGGKVAPNLPNEQPPSARLPTPLSFMLVDLTDPETPASGHHQPPDAASPDEDQPPSRVASHVSGLRHDQALETALFSTPSTPILVAPVAPQAHHVRIGLKRRLPTKWAHYRKIAP